MVRIVCGWCGNWTADRPCRVCGRDPELHWIQRGMEPPLVEETVGRPVLDQAAVLKRIADTTAALQAEGKVPTEEALAERLEVSARTVRRWVSGR